MAKFFAQIIITGSQAIGRALARAVRDEYAASKAAANRSRTNASASAQQNEASVKLGMSVEEAKDILNVKTLDPETILKNYEHLFGVNEKSRGGSLYLQSKVVRAKERIDEELKKLNPESNSKNERTSSE